MEQWDLYDKNRVPLNKLHTRGTEIAGGEYHIVIEVVTINADGKFLLTQRDPLKSYPLLWEFTGGSITAGETGIEGACRELEEETGLRAAPHELHKFGEFRGDVYFLDSYVWKSEALITLDRLALQTGEVCDARFADTKELKKMNQAGMIVPPVWERYMLHKEKISAMITSKPEKKTPYF